MTDRTIAHIDRDFVEWHGGIERYAVWVILIEDPAWLDWFAKARDLVADLVLPGYERQPHVTVLAAGLLAPNHLTQTTLEEQSAAVGRSDSATTSLQAIRLGASRSCPFIEVRDDSRVIPGLRNCLAGVHREDAPQESDSSRASDSPKDPPTHKQPRSVDITPPHITLGLFRGSESLSEVRRRLASVPAPDLPPLRVDTLHLCSYNTRSVQGPLRIDRVVAWNLT